jgi:tetratricopeptide (TPR) repeat protein
MPSFDRDGALKRADRALRQGRIDAAIAEYVQITEAEPRDWKSAHALGDLYVRAGQTDRALAQYARTADQLAGEGLHADALTLFQKCLKLRPGDDYTSTRVREISRKIGLDKMSAPARDLRPAAVGGAPLRHSGPEPADDVPLFAPESPRAAASPEPVTETAPPAATEGGGESEDDRSPWFTMAEIALTDGRLEEGRQAIADALQFDPSSKDAALAMAYRVSASSPDAGYQAIDVLVDRSLGDNDYPAAAAALQEFVTRVRHHLVALMRLVEVAMEGGMESTMYEAQAQLADAYLDAGRGLEARIISEDLVAREPWNRANIERFRKALGLLGEADPDAVIAGRLSGESPFLATDLADFNRQEDGEDGLELFDPEPVEMTETPDVPLPAVPVFTAPTPAPMASVPVVPMGDQDGSHDRPRGRAAKAASLAQGRAAAQLSAEDRATAAYRLGLACRNLGLIDDAVQALETATTSERLRFSAAAWLGAIHRERGESAPAIEWLDRAARWAAPATDIGRAVRYDLGSVLEAAGDHDRALAVFTGLESEQSGYRDVSVRIQRLLDSEPRG